MSRDLSFKDADSFRAYIEDCYEKVGVSAPDILYIYADFRSLGTFINLFQNRNEFCEAFIKPLLKRGKTVVIPTFSYTASGIFEVDETPTRIGVLNKWFLDHPGRSRSEHPLFSDTAIGSQKNLVENVGKSAFGRNSVMDRLCGKNTAYLHIGRPIYIGTTTIHYVEQMQGATYRVHKAFGTKVYKAGKYVGSDYRAFVRRSDVPGENFITDYRKGARKLYEEGLVSQVGLESEFTNISLYWYDQALELMNDLFEKDQTVFIASKFIGYT
jgi:aminoglycoside N3'-acetyltransferase